MDNGKITVAMIRATCRDHEHTTFSQMALGLPPDRFRLIEVFLKSKANCRSHFIRNGQEVYCLSPKKDVSHYSFKILLRLIRLLQKESVDIIHCHRHKPGVYGGLAGFLTKTPVTFFHVHGLGRTRNLRRRVLNRFLFKSADKIIGCSESVHRDIIEHNPSVDKDKVIAMRNSVDYARYSTIGLSKAQARKKSLPQIDPEAVIFGTVARFGPGKGHGNLIRAFRIVKDKAPSTVLVLAGDGPLRKQIEQLAQDQNVAQNVHFLGYRDDIPALLKAIDFFVLPSVAYEGMPLVLLEAMSAGAACIATDLSGNPEIITGNSFGRIVPPDDIGALSDAMTEFAQMPAEKLNELIRSSAERIKTHFDHSLLVKELSQLYETGYAQRKKSRRKLSMRSWPEAEVS